MPEDFVLETRNLTKKFGGLAAVNDVSIEVPKGMLKAVIGPNGAGKTTFFNLLSGVYAPTRGKVFFKGEDVTDDSPQERSQKGIARSFQLIHIFSNLPVIENVRLAVQSRAGMRTTYNLFSRADGYESFTERSVELLSRFDLEDKKALPAKDLSRADQKKLDMVMALATEPDLLLLDEPTAGMAVEEIPEILDVIGRLTEEKEDLTIMMIEHKIDIVMDVAESILVLAEGKALADGTPEEIREDREVQEAYLGAME